MGEESLSADFYRGQRGDSPPPHFPLGVLRRRRRAVGGRAISPTAATTSLAAADAADNGSPRMSLFRAPQFSTDPAVGAPRTRRGGATPRAASPAVAGGAAGGGGGAKSRMTTPPPPEAGSPSPGARSPAAAAAAAATASAAPSAAAAAKSRSRRRGRNASPRSEFKSASPAERVSKRQRVEGVSGAAGPPAKFSILPRFGSLDTEAFGLFASSGPALLGAPPAAAGTPAAASAPPVPAAPQSLALKLFRPFVTTFTRTATTTTSSTAQGRTETGAGVSASSTDDEGGRGGSPATSPPALGEAAPPGTVNVFAKWTARLAAATTPRRSQRRLFAPSPAKAPLPPPVASHAPYFVDLADLASAAVGGKVIFATDDFFAPAHNLLAPKPPVFKADEFTPFGKWYDGWETRRRRLPKHDWCLIELGLPGRVEGVEVNTRFFTGNFAPLISVEGACAPGLSARVRAALLHRKAPYLETQRLGCGYPPEVVDAVEQILAEERAEDPTQWRDIVGVSPLGPGTDDEAAVHYFAADAGATPGVAKGGPAAGEPAAAKTSGTSFPHIAATSSPSSAAALAAAASGAAAATSRFFSFGAGGGEGDRPSPAAAPPVTHVRLNLFPDGGVSRLRIFGVPEPPPAGVAPPPAAAGSSAFPLPSTPLPLLPDDEDLALRVLNLSSALNGATPLCCSDKHFGAPREMLLATVPRDMSSGWETRRHPARPPVVSAAATLRDWVVIKLGGAGGRPTQVEVDTMHFKGNYPESIEIFGGDYEEGLAAAGGVEQLIARLREDEEWQEGGQQSLRQEKRGGLKQGLAAVGPPVVRWRRLMNRSPLLPDQNHVFALKASPQPSPAAENAGDSPPPPRTLIDVGNVSLLRVVIYPDGGIARLRVFGLPANPAGAVSSDEGGPAVSRSGDRGRREC